MQTNFTVVRLAVPASFRWHDPGDAAHTNPAAAGETAAPPDSAAAHIACWLGSAGGATRLVTGEQDEAACLVTITGLSAEQALKALGQGIGEEAPATAPIHAETLRERVRQVQIPS